MKQNYFQMPFVLVGEIIDVETKPLTDLPTPSEEQKPGTERGVGYAVLVEFPNGSRTIFRNVVQACLFGGVGDFFQSRLRASKDTTGKFDLPDESVKAPQTLTTLGDRVLVAFLGGDMRRPVIIGYLPHPQRVYDLPEPNIEQVKETQAKIAYKGFEFQSNSLGETKFVHRGSPGENDTVTGESIPVFQRTDVGPKEMPERDHLEPLPSSPFSPNMPPKLMPEPSLTEPTINPSLSYPDKKYTTEQGFLQLGEWYVVDSEGQSIFLDRDAKTLTITNGLDTIQIDKEHKKIFVESSGDLEIKTANDYLKSVSGSEHDTVIKNKWSVVKGDQWHSVGSTRTTNIVDKEAIKTGTSFEIDVGVAEAVPGGTGSSKDKHRARITLSTGNSFTMDDDSIILVHKTGALLTVDKNGNVSIFSKDGSNLYLNAGSSTITAQSKKGALIAIDDKIKAIDKTGKQMIVIKDGVVDIIAEDQVTVTGKNVSINAGNIAVGNQAQFSAVCGENLQQWLDKHTHIWGGGPTSTPVIPTTTFTQTPLDILSTAVKIRKGN